MEFGQYLRKLRKSKKLGVRELGRRSGLSQAYISQIETSKRNVSVKTLEKLAKGLDVEFITLMQMAWDIDIDEHNLSKVIERYETAIAKAIQKIDNLEIREAKHLLVLAIGGMEK